MSRDRLLAHDGVGLPPEREPAANPGAKRADFRIVDGAHRVAIELKSLGDPQRARNMELLGSCLSRVSTDLCSETVGSLELEPSPELDDLMDGEAEAFRLEFDTRIWSALAAHLCQHIGIGRHEIEGIGAIIVGPRDPTWGPSVAGRWGVKAEYEWTDENAAHRVLMRVRRARRQLAATEADLNVERLLEVRQSSECREFREFLTRAEALDDAELAQRITSLRARFGNFLRTGAGKTLRLLATTAAGFAAAGPLGAAAGVAASSANSFVLERIFPSSGVVTFIGKQYPSIFKG